MQAYTNISIEATQDKDLPYLVMNGDECWIGETLACSALAHRGLRTFQSAFKSPLTAIFNDPNYRNARGRPKLASDQLAVSRSFVDHLVRKNGGTLVPLKGGGPGFKVKVPKKKRGRLSLIILAANALIAAFKHLGLFSGPNALLLDGLELEDEAQRSKRSRSEHTIDRWGRKRFVRDTGRFYRFPFTLWIPARTSDTRCFDKLIKAIRKAARYVAVELYVSLVASAGCRPGEPQWFSFLHWRSDKHGWFGQDLLLRSKGDDGEAEKEALIEKWLVQLLIDYVDGERRALDRNNRGMDDYRALAKLVDGRDTAAADAAKAELAGEAVLLNSQGRRLTYAVVWHHVDASKVLWAQDHEAIEATLHFLRHEYVFTDMRRIELIADEATRQLELEDLCRYMGWTSGLIMIECYDAFEQKRRVREKRLLVMDNRAAAEQKRLAPSNDNVVPIRQTPALRNMFVAAGCGEQRQVA